jgi:hypothetical protein
MTPKEKAKELYDKYATYTVMWSGSINTTHQNCKQCALIAVDEIINTLNFDIRDLDVRGNILLDLIKSWREVKQEIEKL